MKTEESLTCLGMNVLSHLSEKSRRFSILALLPLTEAGFAKRWSLSHCPKLALQVKFLNLAMAQTKCMC